MTSQIVAPTLIDALSGASQCRDCCVITFKRLAKSLYQTHPSEYVLIELINRSLFDLQSNYNVMNVIVAKRLKKLGQNALVLHNTCGYHDEWKRKEVLIPVPSAPIPLSYRGFDTDWQNFR